MRALIILSTTLVFSPLLAVADPAPETSRARPRLEVRETARDLGEIEQGTPVKYQFVIANRGTANLDIARVKPDCGCSIVRWDNTVKPGTESVIEAEVHTDNLRASVTKGFTVFSNDPARPELRLTVSARVMPPVEVTPGLAAMLAVDEGPATHQFTVTRRGSRPMQIVEVVSYAPYLRAEVTPLQGEGRYTVKVTASPDAPIGRTVVPLVIKTDLPKLGSATLVVTVDRGIFTVPPILFCGLLPKDLKSPVHAAVTLSRGAGAFQVKAAAVDDPKLTARLETVRDGHEYRVVVTYAGGWEPGQIAKTLTVTTSDPKQPVLKIPVQAMVRETLPSPPPPTVLTPTPAR